MQGAHATVITTELTAAAGFLDHDVLDLSPTAAHRLGSTPQAPVDTSAFEPELGLPVMLTGENPSLRALAASAG